MAVTPTILISQATLGPGTAGVSREDGVLSQLVTLTDPANGGLGTHTWTMIAPFGSAATLSGAGTPTATFTPDIEGDYLIFLDVDGVKSYTTNSIGEDISTQGGLGVKKNTRRIMTSGETLQFDASYGYGASLADTLRAMSAAWSGAQGEVLYFNSSGVLARLAPGTSGEFLQTQGAAADPVWAAAGGSGIGGSTGATDNAVIRADGVGGSTVQASGVTIDDADNITTTGTLASGALTVTGSIAVSGTVDGRDVAADGTLLDSINAGTQGDVLYVNASSVLAKLGAGTSGQFLQTQGAAANPVWATAITGSTGVTDNRILRSDGTGGSTLQASGVTLDDSDDMSSPGGYGAADGISTRPAFFFTGSTQMGLRRSGTSAILQTSSSVRYSFSSTGLLPSTNGSYQLGAVANRYKNIYANACFHATNTQTTSYTGTTNDHFVIMNGTTLTFTFPTSPDDGFEIVVRNNAAGALTLAAGGTDTLDGATTLGGGTARSYWYNASDTTWYTWTDTNE